MTRLSAIHRLLGVPVGTSNPFDLLGLRRDADVTEQQVQQALDRQLERLRRHPLGSGHEAEEVRLALHAAAAQLHDPTVRAHLVRHGQVSDLWDSEPARPTVSPAAGDRSGNAARAAFRRDATRALAIGRGLNDATRKTLIGLARHHGLGGYEIVGELRSLSGSMSQPGTRPRPAGSRTRPRRSAPVEATKQTIYEQIQSEADVESERMRRIMRRVWSALAVALVAVPGAIVLAVLLWSGSPSEVAIGQALRESNETTRDPLVGSPLGSPSFDGAQGDNVNEESQSDRPERLEAEELLRDLRVAVEMYVRAPGDAAWRFEDAADTLAAWWPTYDEPVLIAMNAQAVEMAHLATAQSASADRTLAALANGVAPLSDESVALSSDEIWPAVWSVGILTRLAADRELAASKLRRVESELVRAIPIGRLTSQETFRTGALTAVEALAARLPLSEANSGDSLLAWRRWVEALDRITIGSPDSTPADREVRERVLLTACERIIEKGPSPAIDPTARGALHALLESAEWRKATSDAAPTPARLRILRWFNDPAIRAPDLAVVIEWLQANERLFGVDRIALSRSASPQQRAQAKERLAETWGLTHLSAEKGLAGEWAAAARQLFKTARETGDIPIDFAGAVEAALLCEAAALQWGFEQDKAATALQAIETETSEIRAASKESPSITRDVRGDGRWSERYLALERREAAERLESLERLASSSRVLGPVDAEVLAEAALLPEQAPVKSAAQRIVRNRKDEFWVLKGLLDALNRAPRSHENITLVEDVTGAALSRDLQGDWADFARRLLLERLLAILAAERPASTADIAASRFAKIYGRRADALRERGASDSSTSGSDARRPNDPIQTAQALRQRWRSEAARYAGLQQGWRSTTDLDRRHEGRIELADGVVQRFAATQVSIAEAMASVIGAERPSRRPRVEEMMSRLASERRRAATVAGQILATERVMVGLWMIRLGVELPEQESEA